MRVSLNILRIRGLMAAAGVVALLLLALAGVHTSPARSYARRQAIALLQAQGLRVSIDDLSYNLFALTVRLRGVTVAAVEARAPFLSASAVRLDLPWRALVGPFRLDDLSLSDLAVTLVRAADGTLNLPKSSGGPGPTRVHLGRVRVTGGTLRYDDAAGDVHVEAGDVRLDLTPRDGRDSGVSRGRLSLGRGLTVRAGGVAVAGTLGGEVAWDGAAVLLSSLRYASPLGRLGVAGRVGVLGAAPSLALTVDGAAVLDRLSDTLSVQPPATGTVAVTGRVDGPLDAPTARLSLTSAALGWDRLAVRRLSTRAVVTPQQVSVEALALEIGGGTANAHGSMQFDLRQATATLAWRGVAADALADLGQPRLNAARLSGTASLDVRMRQAVRQLTFDATLRADAPRGVRLDGQVAVTAAGAHWRARPTVRLGTVAAARADVSGDVPDTGLLADAPLLSSLRASSLRGTVTASVGDLAALAEAGARLGVWSPDWPRPDAGRAGATLQAGGTLGEPTLTGAAELEGGRMAGAGPLSAHLTLAASTRRLRASGIEAALGGNRLTGDAALGFARGDLTGALDLHLPDATALGEAVAAWTPAGSLSAHLDLAGTSRAPVAALSVSGTDLGLAGQRFGTLTAAGQFTGTALSVTAADLHQPSGGRLTASGEYDLASGRHVLTLALDRARLTPVTTTAGTWPVTAVASGTLRTHGTPAHPEGGGQLTLTEVGWDTARLDHATAEVALSDAGVAVHLAVPALALTADGTVVPRAPWAFSASATAAETDIAVFLRMLGTLVPASPQPVTGTVTLRASAAGALDALPEVTADLSLDRLDLHLGDASLGLEQPATARYAAAGLTVAALRLRTGTTTAVLTGTLGSSGAEGLTVSLDGPLADLQPWITAAGGPSGLGLDGRLAASARADGTLERPVLSGEARIDAGRLAWPGYDAVTDAVATVTLRDGVLEVPTLRARWQETTLDGQARVPLPLLDQWLPASMVAPGRRGSPLATAQVRLGTLTPALLAPFVDEATLASLTGAADVELELSADGPALDRVTGSLVVTRLQMSAEGVPVAQVRPTRLDLARGTLRVTDWEWTLAGSPMRVTGTTGLAANAPMDLQVNGVLDLRVLSIFLPAGAADGTGALSMALRGTVGAPVADGTVRLTNGELRLTEPRIGLSGVSGLVVLRPDRIELEGIEGTLNGGQVVLRGGVAYRGLALTDGTLSLEATRVALDVPTGMRTEVNASLTLAVAERMLLSGRVDVLQGAYREPLSLAAALATAARQREITVAGDGAPSALGRVDLNVVVASAEDLMVDNNYGRLDLGLDLRLVGTAAAPSVVGRAAVREGGVLFLGGRAYLVDRGVIDFSDPRAIVPQLDISARTRVDGANDAGTPTQYDITLTITGTPETLKTTLTSVPDRPQADIVSLLATGRLADQVGGAEGAIARDQFLGYLSGETLGFAARAIGFDSIRFERGSGQDALASDASLAGEINPAQRLTVARRISGVAEVTVSQNLRDTSRLTWIAAFMPRRAVELRALSRDDRSRSYEVRHDVSFGGPPDEPATVRAATTRVSTVRFSGDLAVPDTTLARRLRLKAGDRFDFYRWQQDRDRLRRFYLDRGHREVRISARQTPDTGAAGPGRVALEYAVTAGPLTVVEIEGDPLPRAVVRDLERIWSNAIVDVGLTGDVTAAVQRYLAGEGYLRARVRAARIPPDATSPAARLRVRVAHGPRSTSRALEVTGDAQVARSDIDRVVTELGMEAWLKPATLAEALTLLYRQQGLLAATVTAGPVRHAEAAAVLPVRIDEGRPFTVRRVSISGADTRGEAAARRELDLPDNAVYTPEVLRQARLRLGRGYAAEGYNAMTEESRTLVDRAAAVVDVEVTVREGQRQVLSVVTVTGAEGVSPGVVTDALALSPGSPVNMDDWYAGRRRLFQTGLFRRVELTPEATNEASAERGVDPVRAAVTLVRLQPWRLRYGANVTDENAPIADQGRVFGGGLNAMLERQGLLGRPGSSVVSLRYNNDQRVARGTLTWPTLFGRPIASRLFVSRTRDLVSGENVLSFITDRTIVTAEQRIAISPRAQVAYAYQAERNHVFDPDANPDDPFALDESWRQARLTSSVVLDRRNDALEPSRGLLHSSTVEFGLEALGRSGRFLKYSLQQLVFAPLGTRVVSASAVRLNLGKGFGQDLILSERFVAGGTNTVRGYADDALGGFDFFGDAIPGQATLVLNQEVRFPMFRWVRGAAFIDAGNVFARPSDLSLRTLQVGAGLGLRLSTPVGLFRLDLAAPLPRDERPVRWTFGFGHIF